MQYTDIMHICVCPKLKKKKIKLHTNIYLDCELIFFVNNFFIRAKKMCMKINNQKKQKTKKNKYDKNIKCVSVSCIKKKVHKINVQFL